MDDSYTKKVIAIRGTVGKKWLDKITQVVKTCESKWHITCLSPFPLSYNYVVPAITQTGEAVVLKICLPQNEPIYEAEALRFFDGQGATRILQEDKKSGALLLEQALPGIQLKTIDAIKQVDIFVDVAKRLHKPITQQTASRFPTLEDWLQDFAVYRKTFSLRNGPIPQKFFEKAEAIFTEFLKENRKQVLLHGDLHAENILRAQRGWVSIDPKGIMGEEEFESGIFLRELARNFIHNKNAKNHIKETITFCAQRMHTDAKRIADWTFVAAINGLIWLLEDMGSFHRVYLENAKLLDSILL